MKKKEATAELAIGLLLNTSRRISESINAAKIGEWAEWRILWMCGKGLAGSNVGIFGLGRIGGSKSQSKKFENLHKTFSFRFGDCKAIAELWYKSDHLQQSKAKRGGKSGWLRVCRLGHVAQRV